MANFPKHLPVQWELFRNEPLKAQVRREALRHHIEEIDKGRGESDGLWWPDQRYVDVVVPAEYVDPDSLDTFNYRYQVFARPPPIQCPPCNLAEVSEDKPLVRYNVKRIAQCKPLETSLPQCLSHWESRPFALTHPSQGATDLPGQSQNNNSCVDRPEAPAVADQAAAPAASQHSSCANQPALVDQCEALPAPNKWIERGNRATPLKEEISMHRDCFTTTMPATKISHMASAQLKRNANRNKGLEDYALEKCETSTGSPRSWCSYSSCDNVHHQNDTGETKTHLVLRGDDTQGASTLPESISEIASELSECSRIKSDNGRLTESHPKANALNPHHFQRTDTIVTKVGEFTNVANNYDCSGDEKQQPMHSNSLSGSKSFTHNVTGANDARPVSVGSEVANNANNNERNPSIRSRSSVYTPVRVAQSLEGKGLRRPLGVLSTRAPHAENVQSLLCEQKVNAKSNGMAVDCVCPVARRVKRGRRFGYNIPALKDNIARLVFESDEASSTLPPVPKKLESKSNGYNIFPTSITVASLINNAHFPANNQSETTHFKHASRGGKRMGYQISSTKDSIVFGGGHTKELLPLHRGGVRRSCQIGGYRSMANSDNMKSLIYLQNVNGNSSSGRADGREDPEPESAAVFDQCKVIVDIFILEGELDQPSSSTDAITFTDSNTVDPGLPVLPSYLAVPGCTNNNSAITDPILDIQLDRKCMLQARHRANTTDAPSHAVNEESAINEGHKTPEIPYESYKIVGGQQYKSRPPEDLLSELQLPPHLAEYQEFTRRCPNYSLGRYDRSDPANEMLLPGSKSMNTLRMTMNPFMYSRNPNVGKIPPLFYTTTGNSDLKWPLAASKCNGDHASQSVESNQH